MGKMKQTRSKKKEHVVVVVDLEGLMIFLVLRHPLGRVVVCIQAQTRNVQLFWCKWRRIPFSNCDMSTEIGQSIFGKG